MKKYLNHLRFITVLFIVLVSIYYIQATDLFSDLNFKTQRASASPESMGHVYLRTIGTGFCTITNATNAVPIRITVSDITKCDLEDGDLIIVDGVRGNTAANIHMEDEDDTENIVFQVGGLSGNAFNLLTRTGANTVGTVDASCGGSYSDDVGTCSYTGGGRVGKATNYQVKEGPIGAFDGTDGAKTASFLASPKKDASNPSYTPILNNATNFEANYNSIWGFEHLNSAGTAQGGYGLMPMFSALKWLWTEDADSLALVKFAIGDNPDQVLGSPACDGQGSCGISVSGKMDYATQYSENYFQAYSIIRDELSAGQKANFINFYLNDLPWSQAGIGYTGTSLVKPTYTKLPTTSDGAINIASLGTNKTVTGTGTHFTTSCAVGGTIIADEIYARDMLITDIASDTSLTVAVADVAYTAGSYPSGINYACAPRWDASMYGWLWYIKHYSYNPLNGGAERLPPAVPPATANTASPYYGLGEAGSANDGFNNHNHTRALAMFQAGIATCKDDPRGCLLASKADAYMNDMTLPRAFMVWTPFSWNGNTYQSERIITPILSWTSWRVNSLEDAPDPLENTNIRDGAMDWFAWSMAPRSNFIPNADYALKAPNSYKMLGSLGAMSFDNTTSAARNFQWFLKNINWYDDVSAYTAGANVVGGSSGGTLIAEYLNYEPATTETSITNTTRFFIDNNEDECIARYSASNCVDLDVRQMAVSRTAWTNTDETYVFVKSNGAACRDHCGDDAGGHYYIFKNKQPLLSTDGSNGADTNGLLGLVWIVGSRGYPLVGTATDPAFSASTNDMYTASGPGQYGSGYFGTPILWHSGNNNFMHTRTDISDLYKAGAAVTAMERQNFHLKAGSQDYVIDHVKGTMSSAKPFKGPQHYNLNGCGTADNTTCVTVNNSTKTASHIQTTSGANARLNSKVFGFSGEMDLTTEEGDLSDGSYTNGGGYSFRWDVEPASGNVTAIDYAIVHQPSSNVSTTLPTIATTTSGIFNVIEIQDPDAPAVLAFTGLGATDDGVSLSTTHDGSAQYLVTGLESGIYSVTRDGDVVSSSIMAYSGEQSISFSSLSGDIEVTLVVPDLSAPEISNVTASSVGTDSATITWNTDESSTSYVDYGTTLSYGSNEGSATLTQSHSVSLTGLSPDTAYNFRVYSADSNGNSSTSSNSTFTTDSDNEAPTMYAGDNQSIDLGVITTATMVATADDDGLPSDTLTYTWTDEGSNPASVTFTSRSVLNPTITFTTAGTYRFNLEVSDTDLSATDYVIVTVTGTLPVEEEEEAPASSSSGGGGGGSSSGTRRFIPFAVTVPVTTPSTGQIKNNLWRGVESYEVLVLQEFLFNKGLLSAEDKIGYFGPKTENAVKKFQKDQQIVSSGDAISTGYGVVGPFTKKVINGLLAGVSSSVVPPAPLVTVTPTISIKQLTKELYIGMKGSEVLIVQELLISQGLLDTADNTGYFGPKTRAAVRKFQVINNIVSPKDYSSTGYGVVGPATRKIMNNFLGS